MRTTRTTASAAARVVAAALLTGTGLLYAAGAAAADTPSPGASASQDTAPTEAGTSFRTASSLQQGQRAQTSASTGDYLYWMFPAGAGQTATAEATVTLPDAAARHGDVTWQLDVFDGLRRRQACTAGEQTRTAGQQDASLKLSCTLRTIRSWSEPYANDPLPGAYYLRLTVVDLPDQDLGLPVRAEVEANAEDAGGSHDVGGELDAPLTPVARAGATLAPDTDPSATASPAPSGSPTAAPQAMPAPEGGWKQGWWSDRWIWTAAGGVLAALAGVGGYTLTRGPRTARRPTD